jgi:hypothetical protein
MAGWVGTSPTMTTFGAQAYVDAEPVKKSNEALG